MTSLPVNWNRVISQAVGHSVDLVVLLSAPWFVLDGWKLAFQWDILVIAITLFQFMDILDRIFEKWNFGIIINNVDVSSELLKNTRLWKLEPLEVPGWAYYSAKVLQFATLPGMALIEERLFRSGIDSPWELVWRSCIAFGLLHFLFGANALSTLKHMVVGFWFGLAYFQGGLTFSFQLHLGLNLCAFVYNNRNIIAQISERLGRLR